MSCTTFPGARLALLFTAGAAGTSAGSIQAFLGGESPLQSSLLIYEQLQLFVGGRAGLRGKVEACLEWNPDRCETMGYQQRVKLINVLEFISSAVRLRGAASAVTPGPPAVCSLAL